MGVLVRHDDYDIQCTKTEQKKEEAQSLDLQLKFNRPGVTLYLTTDQEKMHAPNDIPVDRSTLIVVTVVVQKIVALYQIAIPIRCLHNLPLGVQSSPLQ